MPLRPYNQDLMFLLPPSLDEWVPKDHPARILSEILERIDIKGFREAKTEGRPAYYPRMMLKVLLWGYANGIRSSRKIESRLTTDVAFMWLAALEKPDFRTICLFRTMNRNLIEKVFAEVVLLARILGMGKLGLIALDGTKGLGFSDIDAMHVMSAEKSKADYFVTCDDDIVKLYKKHKDNIKVHIISLLEFIGMEVK